MDVYELIEENQHLIDDIPPIKLGDYHDDPIRFLELESWKQAHLVNWILQRLVPGTKINTSRSSYSLKHYFSDDIDGFYINNGAFKGAMLISGFSVKNESSQNWYFNITKSSMKDLNKKFVTV
jgi:predicted alpha/beta hydrolase family esterase